MSLKITLFFNGDQGDGWTETYYSTATDPYNFIINVPASVWTLSTAFRAAGVDLFAARATLVSTGQRKSYSLPLSGKYLSPASSASSSGSPAAIQTDALFKIVDGFGDSKRTYFRGLKRDNVQWTGTGVPVQDATLIKAIQAYITGMYNANFFLRYQQRPPVGGLIWYTASSFSPATAFGFPQFTYVTTNIPPAITIAPGSTVTFQGVNKNLLPGFPNITTPLLANTTTAPYGIIVPYLFRGTSAVYPNKNTRFVQTNYIYQPMFTGTFLRFTNHKTGRSFGVARGRSRSVVHSN